MSYINKVINDDFNHQKLVKRSKPRKKTICERLDGKGKRFFLLFLDTSSIHGLNHFTKVQRHPFEMYAIFKTGLSSVTTFGSTRQVRKNSCAHEMTEFNRMRIFWIIVVVLALWGSVYLSRTTWQRYQDSPTVISMDRDMFAWNTTFPCVTVCPRTKLDEKKLNSFILKMKPEDTEAMENFIRKLAIATYSTFDTIPEYSMIPSKDYMSMLVNLSMEFNPALTIGASGVSLSLEPVITELGLCYAVNSKIAVYNSPKYLQANRWDVVEGNDTFFVHPLDGEIFAQLINLATGYDVFLHGPLETPDIASQRHFSEDGLYMKLYVTAISIYTSPDATKLSVLQRKCRFVKESNLLHNPVYSYNLCRIDCRIGLCIKLCGCVPHFYRTIGKEKTCDVQGLHCLQNHEELLLSLVDKNTKKKVCDCLPNCDDVNYVVQSMSLQHWFLGTNLQWGMVSYPKLRYRRDVIFGFTDVLVSVGGMAGLFLGCSVLSFMEIVYFYTLKLFWYIFNRKSKRNRIQSDLTYGDED